MHASKDIRISVTAQGLFNARRDAMPKYETSIAELRPVTKRAFLEVKDMTEDEKLGAARYLESIKDHPILTSAIVLDVSITVPLQEPRRSLCSKIFGGCC
jgi:hypothetical protein